MSIIEGIHAIEKAQELVQEAKDMVDNVLKPYENHRFVQYYKAYGKFGFNRLLEEGNPLDEGLNGLIKHLRDLEV